MTHCWVAITAVVFLNKHLYKKAMLDGITSNKMEKKTYNKFSLDSIQRFYSIRTLVDQSQTRLTRVGLVLIRVDFCQTRVDSC